MAQGTTSGRIRGDIVRDAQCAVCHGRSTRAAMDALIDLGRPKAIRLAVLVDKQGRELPIQPDYAGYKTEVQKADRISVNLVESDGADKVFIDQ